MPRPKEKEFDLTDPFDTWPPFLRDMVTHAVHITATLEAAPSRCRMRDCRRTGNCMSRLTSLEDIACHGGLSDAGERGVQGMLLLLAELGKRFLTEGEHGGR